jgi:hypothetical protein
VRPTDILKEALQEWLKARFAEYRNKGVPTKFTTPEDAFVISWGTLGKSMEAINNMSMLPAHQRLEWSALAMLVDNKLEHIYVTKQQYPERVEVSIIVKGGE